MSARVRKIRAAAFELLFQLDASEPPLESCGDELRPHEDDLGPDELRRAIAMADGAWAYRRACDRELAVVSPSWPALRMPVADRCILRLGIWELNETDTSAAVVINEAVELAKLYGTEMSPAFVNGVLDSVRLRSGGDAVGETSSNESGLPSVDSEGV